MRCAAPLFALVLMLGACGGAKASGDATTANLVTATTQASTAGSPLAGSSTTQAPTTTVVATTTEAPTTTAAPTTTEADVQTPDLAARLLTLADMPGGYIDGGPDSSSSGSDTADPPECDDPAISDAIASKGQASARFKQSDFGPFIFQSLNRADSKDAAKKVMDSMRDFIKRCASYVQVDTKGERTPILIKPLDGVDIDNSLGFVMKLTSIFPAELKIVFTRKGSVIAAIGSLGIGEAPPVDLVALQRTALDNLK